MSMTDPYSQYLENQVMTATPGKLLLMTYDAAIRFAKTALDRMSQGKLDEQSTNITKVQNILLELMASLDPRVDPQLAGNLDSLYTYMFDRLTQASIRDDRDALQEVVRILMELRTTWAEADLAVRTGRTAESPERKAA